MEDIEGKNTSAGGTNSVRVPVQLTDVPESKPPGKRPLDEEREVDYLLCRQCNSPSYVFEIKEGKIVDANCGVCGNDDILQFNIGEDDESV